MQQKYVSCFHIHSVSPRLFIGELNLLILRIINDQWLLIPHNFVVIGGGAVCVCVFLLLVLLVRHYLFSAFL